MSSMSIEIPPLVDIGVQIQSGVYPTHYRATPTTEPEALVPTSPGFGPRCQSHSHLLPIESLRHVTAAAVFVVNAEIMLAALPRGDAQDTSAQLSAGVSPAFLTHPCRDLVVPATHTVRVVSFRPMLVPPQHIVPNSHLDTIPKSCPVCFEPFASSPQERNASVSLPCHHSCCRDCLLKWLGVYRRNTCPLCRALILDLPSL